MSTQPNQADAAPTQRLNRWGALRVFLRDMIILAVMAAGAESALRLVAPEYGRNLYNEAFTAGYPIAADERGFRRASSQPCAAPEIVAVGDSVTFGTGVAWEDTWPARLEGELGAGERRMCVVNTAFPATRVADITTALRLEWADLRPRAVVLAVTGNMISLAWIRREDAPQVQNHFRVHTPPTGIKGKLRELGDRAKSLCLPSFARKSGEVALYHLGLLNHNVRPDAPYGALLAHGWRQVGLPAGRADEAWERFTSELSELRDVVAAKDAALVVTFVPSRFDISPEARDNLKAVPRERLTIDPVARTADICSSLGITFVDVREPLRAARAHADHYEPLYTLHDYTHLDPAGHAVLARTLAATIARLNDASSTPKPGDEP